MKKFLTAMLIATSVLPAMAYAPPAIIQVHDMQMIKEQQFRREVINDYNDVKQEKERYEKRNRLDKPVAEKPVVPVNSEPEIIQDNGEIKIKY